MFLNEHTSRDNLDIFYRDLWLDKFGYGTEHVFVRFFRDKVST